MGLREIHKKKTVFSDRERAIEDQILTPKPAFAQDFQEFNVLLLSGSSSLLSFFTHAILIQYRRKEARSKGPPPGICVFPASGFLDSFFLYTCNVDTIRKS